MLEKISRLFWYDVPDKPKEERSPSIHNGAPVSQWVNRLFGFGVNDDFHENEAYCSTLVWRAIKVLSEPMAGLTIGVFEKKGSDVIRIQDHPLEYVLNVEPSKYYSSFVWRDTAMHHLGITGNSYNEVFFRGNGDVDQILMIDPHKIEDIFLMKNELRYKVTGRDRMISGGDILHFVGSGFNGFVGKNPIECHIDTLVTDRESRLYGKKFYQNGAFLSGVLSGPSGMSDKAYTRLKNSWHDNYSGSENAGGTPILEEGFKFEPIKLDPVSAAWLETRRNLAADVARIYGVPLHMLMDLERATFSNIEHQALEYVKYSLTPWVRRWEDEINRKLFKPKEKGRLFVRFDMSELLRGDLKSMAEYITTLQQNGNLSINEVRRNYLYMPGIDGGDDHLVQGNNMIPVKNLGQQLDLFNDQKVLQDGN